MAGRGGRRPGAGRPKGSKDKLKREKEIAASGLTPLQFMLAVLRDETKDFEDRKWAANAAAPFVHPRLANTTIQGSVSYDAIPIPVSERYPLDAPARSSNGSDSSTRH